MLGLCLTCFTNKQTFHGFPPCSIPTICVFQNVQGKQLQHLLVVQRCHICWGDHFHWSCEIHIASQTQLIQIVSCLCFGYNMLQLFLRWSQSLHGGVCPNLQEWQRKNILSASATCVCKEGFSGFSGYRKRAAFPIWGSGTLAASGNGGGGNSDILCLRHWICCFDGTICTLHIWTERRTDSHTYIHVYIYAYKHTCTHAHMISYIT